jgi:sigma-B regulation protein RsbU (phosphoserine phosphatase)
MLCAVTLYREALANAFLGIRQYGLIKRQAEELAAANTELVRLRAKEQEYIAAVRRELDLARQIQRDFLPKELPELDGWDMAAHFEPALEVSGDFYDVFLLPEGKTGIVIADVSGKGVGAALFVALVRSLIRATASQDDTRDPSHAIAFVNEYIVSNHHQDGPYMFVTAFYGVLNSATGEIDYVNAGHPAPVVARTGGATEFLYKSGPAVGISVDSGFEVRSARLDVGDTLFAYTDGVTEAQDGKGILLGKDSLYKVVQDSLVTPGTLLESVRQEIARHRAGQVQSDDITMVALKRI